MPNRFCHSIFFCLLGFFSFSQVETDSVKVADELPKELVVVDSLTRKAIDPLAPSRAAFYSAILPGLGQAYNKKYWKIPIAIGGIATGIYFYQHNDKQYNRYRDAYKRRLAGYTDDEFYGSVSGSPRVTLEGLKRAQKTLKQNKEISLLITFGIYALNIIDANVDAHLLQYNVDHNLALKPHFQYNEQENATDFGLTLNFKF
ncbi:MAG TPA: DUF5683 domain-containing protein [Aquaticitalea sp.]|nr:DUF5683 domain-containing protein [Aquaticitalea sp.]